LAQLPWNWLDCTHWLFEEFVQRVVDAVAVGIRMRAIVGEKKRRGANSAPRRLH
jgi:hypothetical protein